MKTPHTGLGIGSIAGIAFILIGALFAIELLEISFPLNLENFDPILQYGAALGSIMGGVMMLFRRKHSQAQTIHLK